MALVVSVGAGANQEPLIRRLVRLGHRVAAFDRDPAAPGFAHCAHHAAISSHDDAAALAWIASLPERPAAIGCFSYGPAVRTALRLARRLGLPGAVDEAVAAIHGGKAGQRAFLATTGLALPGTVGAQLLAKPAVGGSSAGIHRLDDPEQARPGEVVEELVEGDEHRVAAWFAGGEPLWIGVLRRWNLPGTFLAARYRALVAPPAWAQALAATLARATGIGSGLIKADVILRAGTPVVLEVDLGICGDHLETALAPGAWSLDLVGAYAELILGGRPRLEPRPGRWSCLDYIYRDTAAFDLAIDHEVAWRRTGPAPFPPSSQQHALAAILHDAPHLPPGLPGRSRT